MINYASSPALHAPACIKASDVAAQLEMPLMQVKKLNAWLVHAKRLSSTRGPSGGIKLSAPASGIAYALARAVETHAQPRALRSWRQNPARAV